MNASSAQLTCLFLIKITFTMLKFSMKLGYRTISALLYRLRSYHYRDQIGMIWKIRDLRSVLSGAEIQPNRTIRIHNYNIIGDPMMVMQAVISCILNWNPNSSLSKVYKLITSPSYLINNNHLLRIRINFMSFHCWILRILIPHLSSVRVSLR